MSELTATAIWEKYQRGVDWHHRQSLYTKADKCHRFYEGDQWSDSYTFVPAGLGEVEFVSEK